YYSFTRYTPFSVDGPRWVGLENYRRLLLTERFWFCLGNSFLYLLVTPALMALSLWAAMVVESALRWAKGLRLVLFLPVVTPTIVAAIAWAVVLREDGGLINTMLGLVGIDRVPWLTEPPFTLISAMFVTLWKGFGFYRMVFLAGLLAVPKELKEAAAIDGASRFGVFRHVTLPALWPVLTLVFIISSISALKVFEEIYVTARGVPVEQQTAVPLIYLEAFEKGDYGMASAIGITLFLIILAFSLVNLRLSSRRDPAAT
ncbi:MAG: carbohydrate ABC transporter permease, partial [Phycisphaerales bacterium]